MLPIRHRPPSVRAPVPTQTACALDRIDGVIALHDRTIPGLRARIDHVVVGRSAVWVIDSRRYVGQSVRFGARPWDDAIRPWIGDDRPSGGTSSGSPSSGGGERLWVGGVDATTLAAGVARRAGIVRVAAAAVLGTAPVRPVLCFEEATWPGQVAPRTLGATTAAVTVARPEDLAAIVGEADGPISDRAARRIAAVVRHCLPAAASAR